MFSKKIKSLVFIASLTMLICACEKNETGMPYGVYKSDVGTIRFEDNKLYFEDMDEEFLDNRWSSSMAGLRYFESMDEGEKLSKEELVTIKKEYKESFDASKYTNKEFSYKHEKFDGEYYVYFTLYEGEEYRFDISYDMEEQYISFGDKEFRIE